MLNSLISTTKSWVSTRAKRYKRKPYGQDLDRNAQYARTLIRSEKLNLMRGSISRTEYENRVNDIAKNYHNNLTLRLKLLVPLRKFKELVKSEF